jgi:NAD-dependent DNA ligase/DNA polymerase/3'-5' exonuclease PolX
MEQAQAKDKIKRKTKKKLIIKSSSSQKSQKMSPLKEEKGTQAKQKQKTKKKELQQKTKKRRKLIIASSTTSELDKEKPLENKNENKTDLNTTVQITKMSARLNEKFIDLMEQLANIMLKQGEPFRARAYQKAQETIMAYPTDIISPDDLKGKANIGATIMEKLNEYVQTGTLKVLEREKNNPVNILGEVYGIGPKKAKELVDKGITTIAALRANQDTLLNDTQKVGLKYYEDILKRIPRAEIEEYKTLFTTEFLKQAHNEESKMEIVGSYRRGAESSGDIDLIITSTDPRVYTQFVDALIETKVIQEVLSRGPTKCLVITRLPNKETSRRVDFLYTSPEEFPFAILYFTGSKIFNTVMRHEALNKDLTMNEHGLYSLVSKKKGEKVEHIFKSEQDIFDYLGLEYKAPHERIDGRAIIKKSEAPNKVVEAPNKVVESEAPNKVVEAPSTNAEKQQILNFKKNGINVLHSLNEHQLTEMLKLANILYRNFEPIMTDNEYDILQDYITEKYPSNQEVLQIGAPVEKNKAKLPYEMASMDKIKPDTTALTNWVKQYTGPYVLSCKLDGVSGLYSTEGKTAKLYTRGDGKVGQDISHLIPHLRLPKTKGVVIRGEFIIPKAVFDAKYKIKFANPRNMVSGIVNQKTINESINDVHFVAYEVIHPVLKPSEQMSFLVTQDVETVLHKTTVSLSNELLSDTLVEWRQTYAYEIDGVIVTDDKKYPRKSGNPAHAFAFKMVLSDQIAEAKVVDVIWTPSKDGYLKPRVQIEPINLGGVRIEYATGFNGAFINDNKVGIGAVIELIRSGDVIPHIRKVTTPAEEAKMPSVPYKWNDTHVDILLEDINGDETVKEKVITGFFKGIGVEGLSSGNIARIIDAGFDSVPKIIRMTVPDFLKVDGFKEKTANKLYNGIKEKIDSAEIITIMSASNIFGRGFSGKKTELIMEAYPDILISKETIQEKIKKIASIKGMAAKTAEAFVQAIPNFIQFIQETGLTHKLHKESQNQTVATKVKDSSHPLFEKTIIMTGFRDAAIQQKIKDVGAKLGTSVSKNTFVVLVKDLGEDTGKAADAKKLGIPLMTPEEFKAKYFV